MTLQQLHYIIALDNYRHFVKAAESCYVAQPTLTLQVKKLEDEIGLTIFDRTSKPLKPTAQGENFITKARQIVREVNGLKEMINTDKQSLKGDLKIGIIPTLAPYLLPLFLKNFSDKHPNINLELEEMQSDAILLALKTGKIDIGLLVTSANLNSLRKIDLFKEPFLLYAKKNHPLLIKNKISEKDIVLDDLWLLDQGHCFRDQVLNICGRKDPKKNKRISFNTGSIETLKRMIQSHFGYTLIPELAYNAVEKDCIRYFKDPQPARQIGLVVHTSFTKELLLKNLREAILEAIPEQFKKSNNFITVKWR